MRGVLCAAALLGASGCVETVAEDRVESALVEAGLSSANAACMAGRMVDRLTIAQLRKLERLEARPGERERPATIGEFVERVRRVGDSEVIAVTASSAALCTTGLAH
ncbi:hypothetical protein GRI40_04555 [Altererythrobacter aerius]|uniref:Lipoprotein n=1 Tax=Tsuneonella aeria TaxID=1837929 RepID=A0A6I4TCI6_9SPHN|nr:hypothetical protein [Tsuneonella aeria]MXO74494.1 hypothetical protein [Tsuneonella aeria]